MNALRDQRIRLATSVVNQATSPVTAPTHLPKADVVLVDLAVAPKNATSVVRLDTSLVTAPRPVAMVAVDTLVDKATEEVDMAEDVNKVDKPATPAVVTATCLVTAPRAKSATTVAKLDISPETAHLRLPMSELATSASNLDTFRLNALTRRFLVRTLL